MDKNISFFLIHVFLHKVLKHFFRCITSFKDMLLIKMKNYVLDINHVDPSKTFAKRIDLNTLLKTSKSLLSVV